MRFMLPWIWLFIFMVGLTFLARVLCALFSEEAAQRIKRHPILHGFWALPGIFSALILLLFFDPMLINIWPPHWLELKHQREEVLERVQLVGGWETLRKDCMTLAATNSGQGFEWFYKPDSALPPTLAALKPMQVQFYPPQPLSKDKGKLKVVHIRVFGMHHTGGHDTPFYGLDVVCEPEPKDYQPQSFHTVSGNLDFNYRKIADGIYEIY